MFVSHKIVGQLLTKDVKLFRNGVSVVVKADTRINYNLLVDLYANKITKVATNMDCYVKKPAKYHGQIVFKCGRTISATRLSFSELLYEMQEVINYAEESSIMRIAGVHVTVEEDDFQQELPANTLLYWKGNRK